MLIFKNYGPKDEDEDWEEELDLFDLLDED